jgi:hypothetical protein
MYNIVIKVTEIKQNNKFKEKLIENLNKIGDMNLMLLK